MIINIPISSINTNSSVLRRVNKLSEGYLGLLSSIEEFGFFGTLLVRECEGGYQLIDGLHRLSILKELKKTTVNVDCIECDDIGLLYAQTLANLHNVETTPSQYTDQLLRIMNLYPEMTEMELARKLGKTHKWIQDRLRLTNIKDEHVSLMVDEGNICLPNAYILAKLPIKEQENFVTEAMSEPAALFSKQVNKRLQHLKESKSKKRKPREYIFKPVPYLKSYADIIREIETGKVAERKQYRGEKAKGFHMALKWIMHLDKEGLDAQKEKHKLRVSIQEEAKATIQAERERKRKDLEKGLDK